MAVIDPADVLDAVKRMTPDQRDELAGLIGVIRFRVSPVPRTCRRWHR